MDLASASVEFLDAGGTPRRIDGHAVVADGVVAVADVVVPLGRVLVIRLNAEPVAPPPAPHQPWSGPNFGGP